MSRTLPLVLVFVVSLSVSALAQIAPGTSVIVTSGPAPVLLDPSSSSPVVGSVPTGARLVAAKVQNGWCYVSLPLAPNQRAAVWGWVQAGWLLSEGTTPPPVATPIVAPAPAPAAAPPVQTIAIASAPTPASAPTVAPAPAARAVALVPAARYEPPPPDRQRPPAAFVAAAPVPPQIAPALTLNAANAPPPATSVPSMRPAPPAASLAPSAATATAPTPTPPPAAAPPAATEPVVTMPPEPEPTPAARPAPAMGARAPARVAFSDEEIIRSIAIGKRERGREQGLRLTDASQVWANALTAFSNAMNKTHGPEGSEGFKVLIYTPVAWLRQSVSQAAKEYREFSPEDVTDDLREPVLRIVAYPDTPNTVTRDGMRGTSSVRHVVLRDERRKMVVQPSDKEPFSEDVANAMGGRATFEGLQLSFPMDAVRELRGPKGDKEFFVTVVGASGEEKDFKIKKKHFDDLP